MTATATVVSSRRRVVFAGAFAVGLAVLIALALAVDAHSGWLHRFDVHSDDAINRWINGDRGQLWCWKAASAVGGPSVFRIAALIGAIAMLWSARLRPAVPFVVVAVGGTILWSSFAKAAVGRSRPTVPHPVTAILTSKSFPSGHALTSFVTLAVVVVLLKPYVRAKVFALITTLSALVVLTIGLSRLVLGVHYPTDVVGGWLLAALWVVTVGVLLPPHREFPLSMARHRIGLRE